MLPLLCELTCFLFDICLYLQTEKNECDENQEESPSGDKEPAGLKQRLAQKLKTEQGKCFCVLLHQWKMRGRVVHSVI